MKKMYFVAIALLAMVGSCSKKTSAPTATKVYNGAKLFAGNCARCHGADGTKAVRTPNLHTITLDKAGIEDIITHGKNHMPAFEEVLSSGEIAALADLIESWRNK